MNANAKIAYDMATSARYSAALALRALNEQSPRPAAAAERMAVIWEQAEMLQQRAWQEVTERAA